MTMREYFMEATKNFKIKLNEEQLAQLERYYALLTEWNKKINLTAITDPQGVAVKHFADSLSVLVALLSLATLVWFADYLSFITWNLIVVFIIIHAVYIIIRMMITSPERY